MVDSPFITTFLNASKDGQDPACEIAKRLDLENLYV